MTVAAHFETADQLVRAVYERLLETARALGPVTEDAKKTSIHLVRRTAFAGVAVRRSWLILTLKSRSDIRHRRVIKREQVSANRWHLEIRLVAPSQVDRQLARWLQVAYEMSGPAERVRPASR